MIVASLVIMLAIAPIAPAAPAAGHSLAVEMVSIGGLTIPTDGDLDEYSWGCYARCGDPRCEDCPPEPPSREYTGAPTEDYEALEDALRAALESE